MLCCQHGCTESLVFLLDVQKFRALDTDVARQCLAIEINDAFIAQGAPHEVCLGLPLLCGVRALGSSAR